MDSAVGVPYTPTLLVYRADGLPTTGTDTVTGTMVTVNPSTGATTLSGAISFKGGGMWGAAIAGTSLTLPGTYTWTIANLVVNGAAYGAQAGSFIVGTPQPGQLRMQDILVSIIRGIGGSVRPAQGITATTVTDNYWASTTGSTIDFKGSEIVILNSSTGAYADYTRGRVTDYVPGTGVFTTNQTLAPTTTGLPYGLLNIQGQGWGYEQILDELALAWDEARPTTVVSSSAALATVYNQTEYAIPPQFVSIASVSVRDINNSPGDIWDDLGGRWEFLADRGVLRLDDGLSLDSPSYTLRIVGSVANTLPTDAKAYAEVPGFWLRDQVLFRILRTSANPAHQRTANAIYANLGRYGRPRRRTLPGEVRLV